MLLLMFRWRRILSLTMRCVLMNKELVLLERQHQNPPKLVAKFVFAESDFNYITSSKQQNGTDIKVNVSFSEIALKRIGLSLFGNVLREN